MPSLGLEMEMPVINRTTGELHLVEDYFRTLSNIKQQRGEEPSLEKQGGRHVAVVTREISSSVDNSFNNLESSIGPIAEFEDNLHFLNRTIHKELHDVSSALAFEGAAVINFSQHPDTPIDEMYYCAARSPKPIYDYWVGYRKWNHKAGIDAKAHNGPTTGTTFSDAIRGLNILLALSPAFIALYGNSPFVAGVANGIKENRQNLWQNMFATSRFPSDRKLCSMPPEPFRDLRHYFEWMFGAGTNMQAILAKERGCYKKGRNLFIVDGDPSVFEFLKGHRWRAVSGANGMEKAKIEEVEPTMDHFCYLQFSHFLDARIRYQMSGKPAPVEIFLEAMSENKCLEELFDSWASNVYIEGRAAGANFPDVELVSLAEEDISRSVVISPSALQLGLIKNGQKAWKLVKRTGWGNLMGLREQAIIHGLHGEYGGISVSSFCRQVMDVAGPELAGCEQWMLAYPNHVLNTMQNGADRALALFEKRNGSTKDRINHLVQRRILTLPGSS